jgi:hypothetical protein
MTVSGMGASAIQSSPTSTSCPTLPVCSARSTGTTYSGGRLVSPEFDLLLACLAGDVGASTARIRNLICDGLDWQELLRIIEHHRVIPQAYGSLSEIDDLVPAEILKKLRNRYQANVRQTLRLTRDLLRVLENFESRGIPVLAYKGPPLAQILAQDVTGRQFSDIDLLVHPSAVQNSKAALIEMGYTTHLSLTNRQEKNYLNAGYEHVFDLPDARNVMELQWRMLPRFYSIEFDICGLFDRSITIDVSGHPVRTPGPEDLLLVLCVHAAKHAWSELSLLWDICGLIQSRQIDWDVVFEQASQLGIRQILAVSLALSESLLGATPTVAVQKQLAGDRGAGPLTQRIAPLISGCQGVDTESISYFRLMLDLRERWQDRVRFIWRLVFTPSIGEWETVRLPDWFSHLYHGVRMYRLAARLLGCLWIGALRLGQGWFGRGRPPQAAEKVFSRGSTDLGG